MRFAPLAWLALLCGCEVYELSLLTDGGSDGGGGDACGAMCGTKCVDLTSDKSNCGACGTTCEDGCSDSVCKPKLLANALGAPHGIVVSGSRLYVANNGSINIQVMSTLDGTGLKNFATSQLLPERLTADTATLYWSDDTNGGHPANGAVESESLSSTLAQSVILAQDLPAPYGIAVEGTNVFFTTTAATNASAGGCPTNAWVNAVLSCPATTGCYVAACNVSGGPTILAQNQTKLGGIAVDGKNLYWADTGASVIRWCSQPICAGGPKTFASGLKEPFDVVSDGAHVYFTDRIAGTISSCPVGGCGSGPTVLATGIDDPLLIAVDAQNVYVTAYAKSAPGSGALVSCDLPACANGLVTLAKNLNGPYGVATDATYVYWSEEGSKGAASTDGTVSKLKKP